MADGLRDTTPPMAIVKEEETLAPPQSTRRSAQTTPAVANTSSRFSSLETALQPDLELSASFRPILDETLRSQPDLLRRRYDEFCEVEKRAASKAVQNSNQVKLYFSRSSQCLTKPEQEFTYRHGRRNTSWQSGRDSRWRAGRFSRIIMYIRDKIKLSI